MSNNEKPKREWKSYSYHQYANPNRGIDPDRVAKRSGDSRTFSRSDASEKLGSSNELLKETIVAYAAVCFGKPSSEKRGMSLVHLPSGNKPKI